MNFAVVLVYVALELGRLFFFHAPDAFTAHRSLASLLEQLFLVHGFTANHESWNYPAWSISVELWVNFAFGALAVMFRRWLLAVALSVIAVTGFYIYGSDTFSLPVSAEAADALLDAIRSVFEFFAGFVAFLLFRFAQQRKWRLPALAEFLVVPLIVWAFGYADTLPNLGLPTIFFIAVLVFAFEAGPLSRLLKWPPFIGLGTISYSVYLTHSLYLMAFLQGGAALAAHWNVPAFIPVDGDDVLVVGGRWALDAAGLACVAVTIFGSTLTYRYIEEPVRLFFNRLSQAKPQIEALVPVEVT
jgi:peptidoglycan/LPS O-acetylase OafA/YrhL